MSIRLPKTLAATVAALTAIGLGFFLPTAPAAADPAPPPPAAGTADHQTEPLAVPDRGPIAVTNADQGLDTAGPSPDRPSMTAVDTEAACNVSDFTGRTGTELVRFIESTPTDCVNTLFSIGGNDAYGAFREAQMVSVANGLAANAANYPGDNSTGTASLVLYLRAGYYVQWYDPAVGDYGPALKSAIQSGLDTFFDNPNSGDVSDANGETLGEAVILVDSAAENARYIYVVERLLTDYDSSYDGSWWMLYAVNNVYTILFRGHQVPEFVVAVEDDPGLLDTVYGFAVDHLALLQTEQRYLVSNAGRELTRFVQHDPLASTVRPMARDLLDSSDITGDTASLWVGVAEVADYYDPSNCSYYDICNLAERLEAAVLPIEYSCSNSISFRAQDMSNTELAESCSSLTGQDAFFHQVAGDDGPVADDRNTTIEVVVFDSSTDYQTYAGAIFGIDTNNGGMYLEGDPAAAGNQPRFIAYEAEWERPDFAIWNLNHEYTHYLDGRFDMYGDFADGTTTPTIWWIEGFAEYVSYSYRDVEYTEAIAEAGNGTYSLDTVFETTYSHDQNRVYRWGYLAVRYMLQSHPQDMQQVLADYRSGDYEAAYSYLTDTIGSRYNTDWYNWLSACAAGDCG